MTVGGIGAGLQPRPDAAGADNDEPPPLEEVDGHEPARATGELHSGTTCSAAELRVAPPSFSCSRSAIMHRRAKLLAPVKGGLGHGKHLPTLRVQLCMLNRGAVQSKPGGSRRLAQ